MIPATFKSHARNYVIGESFFLSFLVIGIVSSLLPSFTKTWLPGVYFFVWKELSTRNIELALQGQTDIECMHIQPHVVTHMIEQVIDKGIFLIAVPMCGSILLSQHC